MARENRPVAFFDMNALSGVPLNRVHNMVTDVEDRIGRQRCGRIEFTDPHSDGRYFIMFYSRDAADLFERLYRQTGRVPRRLAQAPDDVVLVPIEDAVAAVILASVDAFVRHMRSRLN